MPRRSPLIQLHEQGDALLMPYGDPAAGVAIVGAFDPVEVEYAAIRRHAALFDAPHRATLEVTGSDRVSFLNRMLTQELKDLQPFQSRRSFWLSRKGRIDADLTVTALPDRILLEVDTFALERTRDGLAHYIITEDAAVVDRSDATHRLQLHGPAAAALLARLSTPVAGPPIADIAPGQACTVSLTGAEVVVDRADACGEIGLSLLVPADAAHRVYEALSTPWSAKGVNDAAAPSTDLARRVGWHAVNIARVEAGTPLYYLDFGPNSVPAETGVLRDRVSFKKGCYLGQEIVARMDALGHPKQVLVGLRIDRPTVESDQAETGTPVLPDVGDDTPVGAVTSSVVSPMLGQTPIALAIVKWGRHEPGTKLRVAVGASGLGAMVQPGLTFWRR